MLRSEHALYKAIQKSMRYWFCRVILEQGAIESETVAKGYRSLAQCRLTRNGVNRNWVRRHPGQRTRRPQAAKLRRWRTRWGGDSSKVGSPAWKRWMLSKCVSLLLLAVMLSGCATTLQHPTTGAQATCEAGWFVGGGTGPLGLALIGLTVVLAPVFWQDYQACQADLKARGFVEEESGRKP